MVNKCSVPYCKGNYKSGPKVKTFMFPKDSVLRSKWLEAVNREGFTVTKNSRVCGMHFKKTDFITAITYTAECTGQTISIPLKTIRLRAGAIPCIFSKPHYQEVKSDVQESSAQFRDLETDPLKNEPQSEEEDDLSQRESEPIFDTPLDAIKTSPRQDPPASVSTETDCVKLRNATIENIKLKRNLDVQKILNIKKSHVIKNLGQQLEESNKIIESLRTLVDVLELKLIEVQSSNAK